MDAGDQNHECIVRLVVVRMFIVFFRRRWLAFLIVGEESTNGLSVVNSSNGLCEDVGHVKYFKFGASLPMAVLWNRICDNNLVDG